jgi:predicted house-cleaning noncanonical NTP pyrophosphatase (MazG superfamily)
MAKKYRKLVRDRIPAIIEAGGKACVWEILPEAEYLRVLDTKLEEELAEYQESKSIEELADLLEVIRAVAAARGFSWEQLEQIRQEKFIARGGFEKKILLLEVEE